MRRNHVKAPLKATLAMERMLTTPLFSYAQLRRMYVPLVFDQLFIFGIGMLSTAMVSSSGEAAISAVSMVGTIVFLSGALFQALAAGGAILVARARGSGDPVGVRDAAAQTIGQCVAVSLLFSAVLFFAASPLVRLLYPMAEPLLLEYASHYARVICFSYPPYALFCAIFNLYRGLGDSRSSLVLTIVINVTHLVCSFVFINILRMGVTGSGLSYVVARTVGAGMAALWMLKIHNTPALRMRDVLTFHKGVQREIMRLGLPMAAEQVLFQLGGLLSQVYIATLSTASIAANAIVSSASGLANATAFALTALATTVCGQCVGARAFDLARQYCRAFIRVGRGILLCTVVLIAPLMPLVLRLYSPSAQAIQPIYVSLAIVMASMPLVWCDASVPAAMMRAAGDAAYTTLVNLIAMWACRVALGYVLAIPLGLGVPGVWLGLALEWALRAVLFGRRIAGGKWIKVK